MRHCLTGSSARLDTGTIAARLIPLLPRGASSNVPSRETLSGVGAVANPRAVIYVIFYAIFIASMMGIVASRQSSAQVDNAPGPTSSAVSPEKPPPSSGQVTIERLGGRHRGRREPTHDRLRPCVRRSAAPDAGLSSFRACLRRLPRAMVAIGESSIGPLTGAEVIQ